MYDNVTLIAAIGKNYELGRKNELIWHFKEDMKFFKDNTINKTVVMGRNTYESIGMPLPKRDNIVLTSKTINNNKITTINNINDLINYIKENKDEIMIIGGARVYKEMLCFANKLLLTEIDAEEKNADTYFPRFKKDDFKRTILSEHIDEESKIKYKHLIYERKKPTIK